MNRLVLCAWTALYTLGCAGSASVTGTVIAVSGYREHPDTGPIPGTEVRLYLPGDSLPHSTVVADSKGRYRIRVPRGEGCYALYFVWVSFTNTLRTFSAPHSDTDLGLTTLEATAHETPLGAQLECPRPDLVKLLGVYGVDPQPIVRKRWPG